jgi:hypothetical protein
MAQEPERDREELRPEVPHAPPGPMTGDIPEEWRAGRFVTLTVGGDVDMAETHPTAANPEARG